MVIIITAGYKKKTHKKKWKIKKKMIISLISITEGLLVILPILLAVAFVTISERKTMASMQRRLGPNNVGYYGLLQAFADALKLLLKEYVSPTQANIIIFFLGPVITLIFSLLGYLVIPFGSGLYISDYSLGMLYMLAVSSLATYGILLAGWSANSKYAFLGSKKKWLNKDVSLYLKQTISEKSKVKLLANLLYTLCVTPYLWGSLVKNIINISNSQVTKAFNSQVGTSEAICLLSINYFYKIKNFLFFCFKLVHIPIYKVKELTHIIRRSYIRVNYIINPDSKDIKFKTWLSGLIDGDGCFQLTKKGYASLDITMDIRDEHALQIIKNVYGGSIKLVSGVKALRYSLRHKQGFLSLVKDVNGEIRNSYRLMQLSKICDKYGIFLKYPKNLKYDNGWLAGFFDAEGSVTLNNCNGQLAITLSQKTSELLQPLLEIYGGKVNIDKANKTFIWNISNKEEILKLIEYFKKYPSRSIKSNRLHLIPKCYELKKIGAHKAKENEIYLIKSWKYFLEKWNKYR